MGSTGLPHQRDLLHPIIEALRELGGFGRVREIFETVVSREGFSAEQIADTVPSDPSRPRIKKRVSNALRSLRKMGAVEQSLKGVWSLTQEGRQLTTVEQTLSEADRTGVGPDPSDDQGSETWEAELLGRIAQLSPQGFENLCRRLFEEEGMTDAEVTPVGADGGIDGVGSLQVGLVSWKIYFQAKRWKKSVGAGEVRDFRGALSGRGEKGLIITTSTFTKGAREEAGRAGAPVVDLIDGDNLVDLLKRNELGLTKLADEEYAVRAEIFDQFDEPDK
jgi:restriction system protein